MEPLLISAFVAEALRAPSTCFVAVIIWICKHMDKNLDPLGYMIPNVIFKPSTSHTSHTGMGTRVYRNTTISSDVQTSELSDCIYSEIDEESTL